MKKIPFPRRLAFSLGFTAALCALVAQSASLGPAALGRRIALVIGNAAYSASPLKNPVNDAQDMSVALEETGFHVSLLTNATREQMERAIRDFGNALKGGGTGLFYYAGHGVQVKGKNYLIPIGADIQEADEASYMAVDSDLVLSKMESAGNGTNLIILDACRNNPFPGADRALGGRGLAVIEANIQPKGSLIIYATQPNNTAQDGDAGRNGVFTQYLLKHIKTEGLDVDLMLRRVRDDVRKATGDKQVPWSNSSLSSEGFMFQPAVLKAATPGSSPSASAILPSPAPPVSVSPKPAAAIPAVSPAAAPIASAIAELFVLADREGAEVYVNGRRLGPASEIFSGQPAGVEIEVEARSGLWTGTRKVTLRSGELEEVVLKLELQKGNARFQLDKAGDYRLSVDAQNFGSLPATGIVKGLPAGSHDAELFGEGSYWKGSIEVDPAQTVTFKVAPWDIGGLRFDAPSDVSIRLSQVLPSGSSAKPLAFSSRGGQALTLLPVGSYSAEATGSGYDKVSATLNVRKGIETTWTSWQGGSLIVSTDPSGIEVAVDGRSRGASPVALANLKPGTVFILVDNQEWKKIEAQTLVELGKTTQVSYALQPRPATLFISVPADASFSLSGPAYSRNGKGESSFADIPAGTYTFKAGGSGGYDSYSETITLKRGESRQLVPWTSGSLVVSTEPAGALIRVNGADQGKSPVSIEDLKPGIVTVEARLEGYKTESQQKLIEPGKTIPVSYALKPPPPPPLGILGKAGEMIFVEGVSFAMGSADGYSNEKPVHDVSLSDFYISRYEVTQAQYQQVMGKNPSYFKGERLPVEQVSWLDAVAFCNALSEKEGLRKAYTITNTSVSADWAGDGYRLPTEAEWEYAARGGSAVRTVKYAGTDTIDQVAWFSSNSGGTTHPVGLKTANDLGIFDMSGNVWEWCWDLYDAGYYAKSASVDPRGGASGSSRVVRGGCWDNGASICSVATRNGGGPLYTNYYAGFRVARSREFRKSN